MSYLVFARKYRPGDFNSVVGQEHVTRTLANSIKRNRVAHAYLFAGPRGVGKTSIARIFAKALNCSNPSASLEPCLACANCQEITRGSSLVVREIDGASHNSVDNVRDLIESFRALPPPGSRYKIYIIDEVHMLSVSAFNALLKSLEEPPPNTVFILATTESHKIPETVISRCQRFDFRALPPEEIENQLKFIGRSENLEVEPEVFRMIARFSDGSMRDAQSLFDRVCSFADGVILAKDAGAVLGVVDRPVLVALVQAIVTRDSGAALECLGRAFGRGIDPALFLKEFASYWRELLIARFGGPGALERIGVSETDRVDLMRQAEVVAGQDLQDLVNLATSGADTAVRSSYPKYVLEALVVRLATREPVEDLAQMVGAIKELLAQPGQLTIQSGSLPSGGAGAVNSTDSNAGRGAGRTAGNDKTGPVIVRQTQVSAPRSTESTPVAGAPDSRMFEPMGTGIGGMGGAVGSAALSGAVAPNVGLDWSSFVRLAVDRGARMLGEQLKRLAVVSFTNGRLEATGPEFTVGYLEKGENKEKLRELLQVVGPGRPWVVQLKVGSATSQPESGSLVAREAAERSQQMVDTKTKVQNHPAVLDLQRVFPGTQIESIKLIEE